ncbi:MAG: hypothetical protein E7Z90_06845 [Cyanobacteria bacterium SIG29]|nr:hypothetical protein [Cyanobacteria bacterium SIG29]
MANLVSMEKISLKNNPTIKEDLIQDFIFKTPSVLGLGNLTPKQREKIQPAGGRLDILLADDDNDIRYEVEIQLGATDPSHIIRTLEYWDTEKKRYPQFDHCAVIVAEEITGRFMNVISLFNGAIPLIALQMSAYKMGDDILLTFTKVIDRVNLGTDEDEQYEITDRNYWDTNKSTPKVMKLVDEIFASVKEYIGDYELKYNKNYVGIAKDGVAKNFIYFKPKKNFINFLFKTNKDTEKDEILSKTALEYSYRPYWKELRVRLNSFEDYKKNKELIDKLVKIAMEEYNS